MSAKDPYFEMHKDANRSPDYLDEAIASLDARIAELEGEDAPSTTWAAVSIFVSACLSIVALVWILVR